MTPTATEYQIDLDPVHGMIRLTVQAKIITMDLAQEMYMRLKEISASGGPYAAIYDLTMFKSTTIPTELVRAFARQNPSVALGRPHVIVGESATIFGLARLFQVCREQIYGLFDVEHTLEEAYRICESRPQDFTERL